MSSKFRYEEALLLCCVKFCCAGLSSSFNSILPDGLKSILAIVISISSSRLSMCRVVFRRQFVVTCYFWIFESCDFLGSWSLRKLNIIGVPMKGNFSRILRSRKRL